MQITLTPNVDLKDLRDGWPFALCVRGAEDSPATRTALGIYSYPGKGKGPSAIVRTNEKKAHGITQRNSPVKAGESVNMAVTWGPSGFYFYQNGRLIGNTRKPLTLLPFSPCLSVGRLARASFRRRSWNPIPRSRSAPILTARFWQTIWKIRSSSPRPNCGRAVFIRWSRSISPSDGSAMRMRKFFSVFPQTTLRIARSACRSRSVFRAMGRRCRKFSGQSPCPRKRSRRS